MIGWFLIGLCAGFFMFMFGGWVAALLGELLEREICGDDF